MQNTALQPQNEGQKKAFDAEQLKEEKLVAEARREGQVKAAQPDTKARQQAEWSRRDNTPNWSSLSAQTHGYTFNERAINLYRQIATIV